MGGQFSGAGFSSKSKYLFGKVAIQIKLVEGDSAGTVTAFYVSSFIFSVNKVYYFFYVTFCPCFSTIFIYKFVVFHDLSRYYTNYNSLNALNLFPKCRQFILFLYLDPSPINRLVLLLVVAPTYSSLNPREILQILLNLHLLFLSTIKSHEPMVYFRTQTIIFLLAFTKKPFRGKHPSRMTKRFTV